MVGELAVVDAGSFLNVSTWFNLGAEAVIASTQHVRPRVATLIGMCVRTIERRSRVVSC
jgi:hypothetical protein